MKKPTVTRFKISFMAGEIEAFSVTTEERVGPTIRMLTEDHRCNVTGCEMITEVHRYARNKPMALAAPQRRTRLKDGQLAYTWEVTLEAIKNNTREKPATIERIRAVFLSHSLAETTVSTALTNMLKGKMIERVGRGLYIPKIVNSHALPPAKQKALPAPTRKPPKRGGGDRPGARETVFMTLKKSGPMKRPGLAQVLEQNGFAGGSVSSALHDLQKNGRVTKSDDHIYAAAE